MTRSHTIGAILAVASISLFSLEARSQNVQFRQQLSMLPDSTSINFEIGGFGIRNGGTTSSFKSMSTTESDGSFLRTQAFTVGNSADSIRYVRWISYSDPTSESFDGDSSTSGFQTWLSSINQSKMYDPLTTSFATGSSILYIVELRSASNDAVLARIDTIKAYRNSNDDLVWRHYKGFTGSTAFYPLGAYYNQSIYFNVARVENLPTGVTLTHQFRQMNHQPAFLSFDSVGHWRAVGPLQVFAMGSAPMSEVKSAALDLTIAMSPNPTSGLVQLHFTSSDSRPAKIAVYNVLGQLEFFEDLSISAGDNNHSVDLRSLGQGIYTVCVTGEDLNSILSTSTISIRR